MPRDSVDRRIAYDKSTISSYKRVLPNDFILHLRSFEGGLEIVNEEGVVSPAYTILRARNEIIPLFFYTSLDLTGSSTANFAFLSKEYAMANQ